MIHKIAYSLIIRPLLWLPLPVLYLFSDFFYLLLRTVFPYRKKVIEASLKRSFPEKTEREIRHLRNQFYRYFADVLIEGFKNLSMSKEELLRRIKVENPEVMEELYQKGKSVLLVSGHYNNWEWVITSQNLLFPHQAVGIGMPLSNPFWNKKVNERRARNGMIITEPKLTHQTFESLKDQPIATLILSDQSPADAHKSYWMEFLNQPTAVLFGCELLAHTYGHAVVFYHLERVKRGHYVMHLQEVTREPKLLEWGMITERHTQLLEKIIREKPEFWLWSHKRWKREVPSDLERLKTKQRERFNQKFGL